MKRQMKRLHAGAWQKSVANKENVASGLGHHRSPVLSELEPRSDPLFDLSS